jgi:hypothetical protein
MSANGMRGPRRVGKGILCLTILCVLTNTVPPTISHITYIYLLLAKIMYMPGTCFAPSAI